MSDTQYKVTFTNYVVNTISSLIFSDWKGAGWYKVHYGKNITIRVKVQIFWEGHKIWKNPSLRIWRYSLTSLSKWKIFFKFLAFLEYPNFNFLHCNTFFLAIWHVQASIQEQEDKRSKAKICYHAFSSNSCYREMQIQTKIWKRFWTE